VGWHPVLRPDSVLCESLDPCHRIRTDSPAMLKLRFWLAGLIVSRLKQQHELALENLALRQQPAVLHSHSAPPTDGKVWTGSYGSAVTHLGQMEATLAHREPDTVVRWHRKGFALYYWRWISKRKSPGRTGLSRQGSPSR
jgi:putative transposase